jgi:p-aminobenzoyl-glutamate transporter AbgT
MMLSMEGLLRALQPDVMRFVGFILTTTILLFVAHRFITSSAQRGAIDQTTVRQQRKTANQLAGIVCLIAIAALAWRVMAFSAINRIPRADAEKSDVYEQMKKNAEPEIKK